eukprot:TRINITY_DN2148_c0_g1_i2.p1 TRINITY_DN2148_c0_g1~~TRINITY_DN2148_c0_g1_i2.p1  ORF type:complete len:309 (-),score=79.26 TRINITY_DN2148_c0_g1_i2:56-946(-)
MSKQPILLFGSTGYFGGHMKKYLESIGETVVLAKSRLENRADLVKEFAEVKPRYIIMAAGIAGTPNIDWCETHREETIRINVVGTVNCVDAANDHNITVAIFGSGCLYEYDATHPMGSGIGFLETDEPNFRGSFYVRTRILLEKLLTEGFQNFLYFRVRFPISDDMHPRCVLSKLIGYEKVVNVPNSFTVLDDLMPVAYRMCEKNCRGFFNFCNPGVISHNELLELYKKYIDPDFVWKNFTVDEQAKILAAGRSNNELNVDKLLAVEPVPEIHATLEQLFQRMKARGIQPRPKKTA